MRDIDPDVRLAEDRSGLVGLLADLDAMGARPWAVGQAALTVLGGPGLSSGWPIVIWVDPQPGVAEAAARWRGVPGDGDSLTLIEVRGDASARGDRLRREAKRGPRCWAVAVDAAGEIFDPCDSVGARDAGLLVISDDDPAWVRAGPDRALHAAALAAATGLRPGEDTLAQMRRDATRVLSLDRRAWRRWMETLLTAARPRSGLEALEETGILPLMAHEVSAMVGFHRSCPVHHKDIWDHTLQVVDKCPPDLVVRWSALMHDVGKVWTRQVTGRSKVQFLRHEELGASLMAGVAARFGMDDVLRDQICYVIANHARANVYSTEWTDAAVRRLIRDMGPHLDAVLAFSRSDFTTKRAWRVREVRELGEELMRRIAAIRAADAKVPPLPKGLGHVLMEHTGRPPGRWLGAVQRRLEAAVDAGELAPQLSADVYCAWVVANAPALLEAET